jgi:Protein phosphatase 2C
MEYKTNHAFQIGAQHLSLGKPCQDYAVSGSINGTAAYAIVSDGCSSGGETDIGARIVTLATKRALEENAHLPGLTAERINLVRDAYMETYRRTLGLEHRDMLATPNGILVHVTGDGVVVTQYELDTLVHEFSWADNKPYYPAYRLGNIDAGFVAAHQDNPLPLTTTVTYVKSVGMGGLKDGALYEHSAEVGMTGMTLKKLLPEQNDEFGKLVGISLFSDGLTQVDTYDTLTAAQALTSFKSTAGDFLVRRMNKFLQESRKVGRGPIDDIACATILFTQSDTTEGG